MMNFKKKKIVVLTSKGGYGHKAAFASIAAILSDYEIIEVNPIEKFLERFDITKILSFGRCESEQFYNKLVTRGWLRTINVFCRYILPLGIRLFYRFLEQDFFKLLHHEKPDLLLSLIPIVNYPAAKAAQKTDVPFLIITLDGDLTLWLMGLERTNINFTLGVPTMTPFLEQQLTQKKISLKKVVEVGFPIRKEFFETKNEKQIRSEWSFPPHRPIVMLMTGGTGSDHQLLIAQHLLKLDLPIHLVICIGNNPNIQSKLKQLEQANHTTYSIVPFTTSIAELMAVSEVLITKPGANTCFEAIHYGLPIILDLTATVPFWEIKNIDWVSKFGTGVVVYNITELGHTLKELLSKKRVSTKSKSTSQLNFEVKCRELCNLLVQ